MHCPPSIPLKKKRTPLKKIFTPSTKALTALLLLGSVQAMEFKAENPTQDTVSKAFQKVDIKSFKPSSILKGKYEYKVEGEEPQKKLKNQKVTTVPVDSKVIEVRVEEKRDSNT